MSKTLKTIVIAASLSLAAGAGFIGGIQYQWSRQHRAPPTVRFANEYMTADVYATQHLIGNHSLEDVEDSIWSALTNANGNLLLENEAYIFATMMDDICLEEKYAFLFGEQENDNPDNKPLAPGKGSS